MVARPARELSMSNCRYTHPKDGTAPLDPLRWNA
jgi:hypothetical protein